MKPGTLFLLTSFALCSTFFFFVGSDSAKVPTPLVSQSVNTETPLVDHRALSRHSVSSRKLFVPENVARIFKLKCFICHTADKFHGGFDLEAMRYQTTSETDWQPMDWAGATRIKLAILPIDGKPARMPRKFQSTWHPLTQEEANTIAAWTDYPFER